MSLRKHKVKVSRAQSDSELGLGQLCSGVITIFTDLAVTIGAFKSETLLQLFTSIGKFHPTSFGWVQECWGLSGKTRNPQEPAGKP